MSLSLMKNGILDISERIFSNSQNNPYLITDYGFSKTRGGNRRTFTLHFAEQDGTPVKPPETRVRHILVKPGQRIFLKLEDSQGTSNNPRNTISKFYETPVYCGNYDLENDSFRVDCEIYFTN